LRAILGDPSSRWSGLCRLSTQYWFIQNHPWWINPPDPKSGGWGRLFTLEGALLCRNLGWLSPQAMTMIWEPGDPFWLALATRATRAALEAQP
jgi:hypothetical protein